MLQPYAPKGLDKVSAKYRDPKNPPAWVGMDVYGAAICFNTVEAQKLELPKPETWKDLTKPVYKGTIVMPNPASSGTGYLDVAGWIQMWGEADAWKFMDALHENIAQYTHSGCKPCRQAGAGEFPIGVSFEYRAITTKKSGAPIDIIFPTEGLGWDLESSRHHEGHEEARRGEEADGLAGQHRKRWRCTRRTSPCSRCPGSPSRWSSCRPITRSGSSRTISPGRRRIATSILAEWTKRYDGKSEAEVTA